MIGQKSMLTIKDVMETLPQVGKLEMITTRSKPRGDIVTLQETEAVEGLGLKSDHRTLRKKPDPEAKRQVTLIQKEHLDAVASMLGKDHIDPALTRRNLVVSGINLLALKDRQFQIGEVVLEYTGPCHPCTRMEENLGPGGYNAMRGHGGITARVVQGGVLRVGDSVVSVRSKE
jgi:MOSC domain-containing protein YiiM